MLFVASIVLLVIAVIMPPGTPATLMVVGAVGVMVIALLRDGIKKRERESNR